MRKLSGLVHIAAAGAHPRRGSLNVLCATAARPACTSWLTPHAAVEGMKGAATTAGERNILLGDGLEIVAVIPKATKDVASKGTSHEACITKWKIRAQL